MYDEASSQLFLGDEQGSVTSLSFLQPLTVLFQRRGLEARPGQAESVYWPVSPLQHRKSRRYNIVRGLVQHHLGVLLMVQIVPVFVQSLNRMGNICEGYK